MSSQLFGSAVTAIQMGHAHMMRAAQAVSNPQAELTPDFAVDLAIAKVSVQVGVQLARTADESLGSLLDILA